MKTVIAFLIFGGLQLAAQDMQSCPMHKEHMKEASQHQADVEKHGDEAMGFPHDKTTHHFRLYSDGGAIEVTVNDTKDSQNMQAIRSHLTHIVTMFSNGEFSIPMFVHDQVPPGVPVMKEKRAEISYSFEELSAGGRVRIKTRNSDALKAIHEFLRFQIADHHTGDATDIGSFSAVPSRYPQFRQRDLESPNNWKISKGSGLSQTTGAPATKAACFWFTSPV
jgi:hypothetical protein